MTGFVSECLHFEFNGELVLAPRVTDSEDSMTLPQEAGCSTAETEAEGGTPIL